MFASTDLKQRKSSAGAGLTGLGLLSRLQTDFFFFFLDTDRIGSDRTQDSRRGKELFYSFFLSFFLSLFLFNAVFTQQISNQGRPGSRMGSRLEGGGGCYLAQPQKIIDF